MSDRAQAALTRIVEEFGPAVGATPERVRALLSDLLGPSLREARAEVDALVLASEEGIPSTLSARATRSRPGAPARDDGDLTDRLVSRGLTVAAAQEAVTTWAGAMGLSATLTAGSGAAVLPAEPTEPAPAEPATLLPGADPRGGAGEGLAGGSGRSSSGRASSSRASSTRATSSRASSSRASSTPAASSTTAGGAMPWYRHRTSLVAVALTASVALVGGAWALRGLGGEGTATTGMTPQGLISQTLPSTPSTGSSPGSGSPTTATPPVTTPPTSSTTPPPTTSADPRPGKPASPTTAVPPAKPTTPLITPDPLLVAAPVSATWQVTYSIDADPACMSAGSFPPHWAGQVKSPCLTPNAVPARNLGLATTWTVEVSGSQWGRAYGSGTSIVYEPQGRGWGSETFRYRLVSGGTVSNWSTVTVTVTCNAAIASC